MDESVQKHLTPALDDASRLLLKAADYIDRFGLSCGGLYDEKGRACTVAVILNVGGHDLEASDAALKRVHAEIYRSTGDNGIGPWSDSTPAEQVSAKLRAVALGL